jgi:hypothetical protein
VAYASPDLEDRVTEKAINEGDVAVVPRGIRVLWVRGVRVGWLFGTISATGSSVPRKEPGRQHADDGERPALHGELTPDDVASESH